MKQGSHSKLVTAYSALATIAVGLFVYSSVRPFASQEPDFVPVAFESVKKSAADDAKQPIADPDQKFAKR